MEPMNDSLKRKAGRELARHRLSSFSAHAERALERCDRKEHVAILTFGSAGDLLLVGNSDTDFTILSDGNVSELAMDELQALLFDEFQNTPWNVSFKSWERIKVNPMDLLSIRFLCGNRDIFVDQVLRDPAVSGMTCEDTLVSILAGNDLHLRYMASGFFSRLLRLYHTAAELPVEIQYGDVKYYLGGTRCVQDILMIAMLYSGRRFLADTSVNTLVKQGIFTGDDLDALNRALDFLLAAKDLCCEGNNIFHPSNRNRIVGAWGGSEDEIRKEYDRHTAAVQILSGKAHEAFCRDYGLHEGVLARTQTSPNEQYALIETGKPELWRILALRSDLDSKNRAMLTRSIVLRQTQSPHTMLDELLSMLQFSSGEDSGEALSGNTKAKGAASAWMTDQVVECFERTLQGRMNQPDLIRLAVHNSFLPLFRSGNDPDLQNFSEAYLDRVKKFFHCHTVTPDAAFSIAASACRQIAGSGFFHPERLTLLELHPTNRCNLSCSWCTYQTKDADQSLRFEDLERVRDFCPIEILVAGGGEPTLFRDGAYGFGDAILRLRALAPGARIRLITNGTVIPEGDWQSNVDEISVSLDEESAQSYRKKKGLDLFQTVWRNIERYLFETPVSMIRVTKIYDQQNLAKSVLLAERLFPAWNQLEPGSAKRRLFRFMLFPLADDRNPGDPYASSRFTAKQRDAWLETLRNIQQAKPDFYRFLQSNTNLVSLAQADPTAPPAETCWPVAHYALLGADRNLYPCFAACSTFRATAFGTVESTPDELLKIRESLFACPPLQCRAGCRPGSVFYGLRSKEYCLDQRRLSLPSMTDQKPAPPVIVHVSYQDPEHLAGGQGWAVYNLSKEQAKRGALVYWLSPCIKQENPGEFLYENGSLRVVKIKFTEETVSTLFADDETAQSFREAFGRSAVETIQTYFPASGCVVHLHGFIQLPSLSLELRRKGYRVVSTFHMLLSKRNEQLQNDRAVISYLRERERTAIMNNSIITVPSSGMAAELLDVSPDYKGRICTVANGIGEEHFTTPFSENSSGLPLVVSYGRISPEKGFDLFVEAAKSVLLHAGEAERLQLRFLFFGNTDDTITARKLYADSLLNSIRDIPAIQARFSARGFLGAEKIALIDPAMFGVVLSRYEPFGMVIPELMARGKPVITTATPGAIDILQSDRMGRNDFGYLVEPTADSVANAIEWMLRHPADVKKMQKNALERAGEYRWEKSAEAFGRLYRE
ncbi:MAG: glycosyltransferase [Eubacteriales bacterium]|nr:glycosyltransferase [Eubacteriales bacterium]